jgi:TadE-like protein
MLLYRTRPRVAQALVEFALVVPLIVSLSLGVLELALYAHARDVASSAVQEGARLAAEDGRTLDEGYARARTLVAAGVGTSLDRLSISGTIDADIVEMRLDASLQPIVPLGVGLPVRAEAWVARERFRPGGR